MLHKLELCVYLVMAVYWLVPMCPWPVKVDRGREDMSKCVCEKKQTKHFPIYFSFVIYIGKKNNQFSGADRPFYFIFLHYVYALHTKRGEGNINFSRPAVNFLWCSECQNLFFFFIFIHV